MSDSVGTIEVWGKDVSICGVDGWEDTTAKSVSDSVLGFLFIGQEA